MSVPITEETVRLALDTFVKNYNTGDMESACTIYHPGALVVTTGVILCGAEEVLQHYTRHPASGQILRYEILHMRIEDSGKKALVKLSSTSRVGRREVTTKVKLLFLSETSGVRLILEQEA